MAAAEFIVVGAGMVGSAIAYGLARRGRSVVAFDGGDGDLRAARANFGLVWVQGKGAGMPAYQRLTRASSDLWPGFVEELRAGSGKPVDYERNGGLHFCLGEAEFEARAKAIVRGHNREDGAGDTEMVDRRRLESLLPRARLGPGVIGASYCWRDGHVNPLQLLVALQEGVRRAGGTIRAGCPVERVRRDGSGFAVLAGGEVHRCDRLVIAAGLASSALGREVGLDVPVRPERGQVLVTERLEPMLQLPASGLRQTAEGSIMIGATQEDAGLQTATTVAAAARLAARATAILPALAAARLVRQWAGLRVLSPDSYPVYLQSERSPGAFAAICHSGVTLAAAHGATLAGAIDDGNLTDALSPFHPGRFDVQKT